MLAGVKTPNLDPIVMPTAVLSNDANGTGQTPIDSLATTLSAAGALAVLISTLLQMTGAVTAKAALADLIAVVGSYHDGDIALVLLDADVTKRGIYKRTSGQWVKIDNLPADVARASASEAQAFRDQAEIERRGAEAARDIAAGYASDAVSQGNVPIYGTVNGLSALAINAGMNAIRLNGWASPSDGGSWLAAEVNNDGDLLPGQQLSNEGTRRWELTAAKSGPVPATALGAFTGTAVQDAANYMHRNGGGEVYLPSGSINIASATVALPQQVSLRGGKGSHFRAGTVMDSLVSVANGLTKIRGLVLDNPDGKAQYGVTVNKPANDLPFELSDCYVASFAKAVRWLDGDCLVLNGNTGVANGAFLDAKNDCRNTFISKNYILGGTGLNFEKATVGVNGFTGTPQGAEGVAVIQNTILPGVANAICVGMNHMLNFAAIGNVFDQIMDGGSGVGLDATKYGDGSIKYIDFSHNWFGRQAGKNAQFGLYMVGPCRHVGSHFNRYVGFQNAAIYGSGGSGLPQVGFTSIGDKFSEDDKNLRDLQLQYSHLVAIEKAFFQGTATIVEGTDVTGRVDGCIWNSTLPNIALGLRYGVQGLGMELRNSGQGTIAASTVGIFNHGLSFTPSLKHFRVAMGSFSPNGTGDLVIPPANITSTQFQVSPRIAPGGDITVSWSVDMTR